MSLWIFDYDDTVLPSYISSLAKDYIVIPKDVNNIIIVLLNLISTFDEIIRNNGNIVILTASSNPWVTSSLDRLENIVLSNKKFIDMNYLKDHLINSENEFIINVLKDGFTREGIINKLDNIYYVHEVEFNLFSSYERSKKYNSLKHIINKYGLISNIIILGDAYDNEGIYSIEMANIYPNKNIKYVQYVQSYDITLKIEEQILLYFNIKNIKSISNSAVLEINS